MKRKVQAAVKALVNVHLWLLRDIGAPDTITGNLAIRQGRSIAALWTTSADSNEIKSAIQRSLFPEVDLLAVLIDSRRLKQPTE